MSETRYQIDAFQIEIYSVDRKGGRTRWGDHPALSIRMCSISSGMKIRFLFAGTRSMIPRNPRTAMLFSQRKLQDDAIYPPKACGGRIGESNETF